MAKPDPDAPIAIVGLSCRLPGGASNPDKLWDVLARGLASNGLDALRSWHRDYIAIDGNSLTPSCAVIQALQSDELDL